MEANNPKEPYFLDGYSYSEIEISFVKDVRAMSEGKKKAFLIECFEIETGKPFPFRRTVKFGYNHATARLSSLEIQRGTAWIAEHPREAIKFARF